MTPHALPEKSLLAVQEAFTALIRSGQSPADFSHIEPRRLQIYQHLFFNNIENMLGNGFPVIKKIISKERWQTLVKEFWLQHRCQTPYFPRLGEEFVRWMQEKQPAILQEFPFFLELAHYEYMEVVVDLADVDLPESTDSVMLDSKTVVEINPASVLLHYAYPVHRISPDWRPEEKSLAPVHLLVYRNREHQVKFMELSEATAQILAAIQAGERSFASLIDQSLKNNLTQLITQLLTDQVLFIKKLLQ